MPKTEEGRLSCKFVERRGVGEKDLGKTAEKLTEESPNHLLSIFGCSISVGFKRHLFKMVEVPIFTQRAGPERVRQQLYF